PIFFFSSRRRHTRFSRDWSSDVCSSDLSSQPPATPGRNWRQVVCKRQVRSPPSSMINSGPACKVAAKCRKYSSSVAPYQAKTARSEERRVGKECRAGWAQDREREEERAR